MSIVGRELSLPASPTPSRVYKNIVLTEAHNHENAAYNVEPFETEANQNTMAF